MNFPLSRPLSPLGYSYEFKHIQLDLLVFDELQTYKSKPAPPNVGPQDGLCHTAFPGWVILSLSGLPLGLVRLKMKAVLSVCNHSLKTKAMRWSRQKWILLCSWWQLESCLFRHTSDGMLQPRSHLDSPSTRGKTTCFQDQSRQEKKALGLKILW